MNLITPPLTDPTPLLQIRDCLYGDDMMVAGLVWLDFFTWLDRNPGATPASVGAHFGLQPRGADVMLTYFKARQLVEEVGGSLRLTPVAHEHFVAESPWFLGPYYASLKDRPIAKDLLEVMRSDRPANWGSQQEIDDWHASMETEPFATQFTAAMDCRGIFLAQVLAKALDLSGHRHLLDIGGGSAIYACSLLAHHPHLRGTVMDKPPVDGIARRAIEKRGFSDRIAVVAGDMFLDEIPPESDAHLFSNVLHDWAEREVRALLQRSYASLPAGGMLIVHDAFLNVAKDGPLHVAEYSVMLMHATQGRCYSSREIGDWAEACGFHSISYRDTAAARGVLTALK